ncbi:histidine phosphatase family protein [Paracoccus sp. (in: a-proteobacteria)]|uniref:histidine phosphatase family protein n=1 Tax=Paracoccus sp. TaxID=267 RepID=UPI0026DF7C7C|nr:histidine phosphatase family protein [Paracoccus sp. (in: a-proteobacteria)]MDO5646447.1 histidine phosphatase family protein [Paracoccus sp. (in: a-proteobacteria)]
MRLMMLRHAPAMTGGRLAGRTDVDADCSDARALAWVGAHVRGRVLASPARRCVQTAQAIGHPAEATDAALWEQNHGIYEGATPDAIPDLGPLPAAELAAWRAPGGESFTDMAARVIPVLRGLSGDTLIVAHAGTVRAALSMVVGPAALSFSVAPLSLTTLRRVGDDWAVDYVNLTAPKVAT